MNDLISRQEAIDALDKIFPADPMRNDYTQGITCGAALATEYIKQLPSAQPEPCDDPRADVYYLAEKIGIHRLYALVVELRGEPDPCEDAVSRADVIREISESVCDLEYDCDNRALCEVIKALPPVTPKRKTGKWIYKPNEYDDSTYECSQCEEPWTLIDGTPEENNMNYCPNCGAKMEDEE